MTANYALIKRFNFQIMKYSSFGIVIGFLLFLFSKSTIILVVGFALIFISYPIALLSFEKSWFNLLDKESASAVYAHRYLIISLIWAIGEIFFSSFVNSDNQVRLLLDSSFLLSTEAISLFLDLTGFLLDSVPSFFILFWSKPIIFRIITS
ncbi:MAG: hypothetical protein H6622_14555 [Halobacteriovoraceae bacterium]|nr:hypothetical protein [Halobacteriovoraceae bacterium]